MAPKSAGSSPASPNIPYNPNSYVANHFNILNSKKVPRISIIYTTKTIRIVKALYSNRIIQGYVVTSVEGKNFITFNTQYYRGVPYFSHFKVVSVPSKSQTISLKALRIAVKSIGKSLILLETDKGIITHNEAITYAIGGKIMGIVS